MPQFACGAATAARGCRPPHPPRLTLTCWRTAAARAPPICEGVGAHEAMGELQGGVQTSQLDRAQRCPTHRPIPTPPLPRLEQPGERQQRGGWWGSGARAGRGASPMPPPVPGFLCPPPSTSCPLPPAPCPLPLRRLSLRFPDLSLLQSGDGSSCRRMCGRAWPSCMSRAAARAPGAGCSSR